VLVERWLRFVVDYPWVVLAVTFASIVAAGVLAGRLHKDTSANAYIEPGNPALLYRERVIDTSAMPSAAALRTPPLPSTDASRGRAGTFVTFVVVVMGLSGCRSPMSGPTQAPRQSGHDQRARGRLRPASASEWI
jgi:hypothetical protein